jgi:hypothetical protein
VNVAATSLDPNGSLHADDGLTDQQLTQLLRVKEDNVLLKEQVKALDQKLMAAKDLLKEQEERHGGVTAGSVPAGGKRIQELEKTIDRLKVSLACLSGRAHGGPDFWTQPLIATTERSRRAVPFGADHCAEVVEGPGASGG